MNIFGWISLVALLTVLFYVLAGWWAGLYTAIKEAKPGTSIGATLQEIMDERYDENTKTFVMRSGSTLTVNPGETVTVELFPKKGEV